MSDNDNLSQRYETVKSIINLKMYKIRFFLGMDEEGTVVQFFYNNRLKVSILTIKTELVYN